MCSSSASWLTLAYVEKGEFVVFFLLLRMIKNQTLHVWQSEHQRSTRRNDRYALQICVTVVIILQYISLELHLNMYLHVRHSHALKCVKMSSKWAYLNSTLRYDNREYRHVFNLLFHFFLLFSPGSKLVCDLEGEEVTPSILKGNPCISCFCRVSHILFSNSNVAYQFNLNYEMSIHHFRRLVKLCITNFSS